MLYGEHDQHLLRIEQQLGVSLASRGNRLAISGPPASVEAANAALTALYQRLKKGLEVGDGEVDAVVRMAMQASRSEEHTSELPSLMRISYAVFCLKKKTN